MNDSFNILSYFLCFVKGFLILFFQRFFINHIKTTNLFAKIAQSVKGGVCNGGYKEAAAYWRDDLH